MAKQLQIAIPAPCHEDWNKMTPVDKGKFCGSCQKQVVDFSTMSDRQVAEFFKKPSTGSICGRFMSDQLDRAIDIPKKRIPWLNYFFQIVIPTFLVSLKTSSAKAQGEIRVVTTNKDTARKPVCEPTLGTVARITEDDPAEGGVRGYVMDAVTGAALPAASVTMLSTIGQENINVKKDGAFMLNIYRKITVKKIAISCEGYEKKEMALGEFLESGNGKHIVALEKNARPICTTFFMGDTVIAKPVEKINMAGNRMISGDVMDETGDLLPGAGIMKKGEINRGVSADNSGRFRIFAKTGDIIIVTGAGLEPTEATIGSGNTISVTVKRLVFTGQEVVVTSGMIDYSYVSKKKKKTNAVKKEIKNVLLMSSVLEHQTTPDIKIFPNPVENGSGFKIDVKKIKEGYYSLQLIDMAGQPVHQQQVWVDAKARILEVDMPIVAAGTYFLTLSNKQTGQQYSEKIIIQ